MALTIGTHFGSHEITALLGKGGMGEVYRARDLKLKREVAIKVLPEEFARDAGRISRFQREAEVLASLNHPNIAAIYDLAEANGTRFLVLELVEGETLADRIQRGPIPVEETLKIAQSICEALEAAHERGIIHRDLKPANVKITPEGKIKVLDFGLAKALEVEPAQTASNSPTMVSAAAMSGGVILGTAGYMSPEQAKGHSADQRSDIFSFGCVLFEMLTGRQTFSAETVAETLASVLMREPDLKSLPANLHPNIEDLLRRCLAKDRKERLHSVADVRLELVAIIDDPYGLRLPSARGSTRRPLWRRALPVVAAFLIAVALTAFFAWYTRPSTTASVMRFPFVLPEDQRFTNPGRHLVAMSPDGTSIVYVANQQLYIRKMSEMEARPIPDTTTSQQGGVTSPFFSPDGRWVGFFAERSLKKISITGGSAVVVCDATNPFGVSWGLDDQIYFGQQQGIFRVSANGGNKEAVVKVKSGEIAHGPQLLPGGDALLFTLADASVPDRWEKAQIVVLSLKSGERHVLNLTGSDARYVPTGHLVYSLGSRLLAIPFDVKRLHVAGGPTTMVDDVMRSTGPQTGAAHFSFSNNGYLAYIPDFADLEKRNLVLVDRAGIQKSLNIPAGPYHHPRISPDGKRLAVHTGDGAERGDIVIFDLAGAASPIRLTFGGSNSRPIWRDNDHVVFASNRDGSIGIFQQRADTPGSAELLTKFEPESVQLQPESWSPDRKLFFSVSPGDQSRIWMVTPGAGQKPTQVMPAYAANSNFPLGGRWFVYTSTAVNRRQNVYVQPYPLTGAMYQVSTMGGHYPIWSPDGKQIYYATDEVGGTSQIMSVDVQTQPRFVVLKTTPLPVKGILTNQAHGGFDITPDGKYFVVLVPHDAGRARLPQINITLNWFEELKQRVPVR
jgi:serine/threonine protein kinase/Tol biopolymer transport system component